MGNEDDLVKSVYLSLGRIDDPERRKEYERELERVAEGIKNGEQPAFDSAELERLRKQKAIIESVPASSVWKAVLRFFLPGVGLLALLWVVVLALRSLR
jgi:hypothetical protein